MKVVFSRKGVDSGAGGCASPIVDGVPISLPIPVTTDTRKLTTYRELGLGEHFERATRGKRSGDEFCHEDPMFGENVCAFGQTGIAQSHLMKQEIGIGDVFLFFGRFSEEDGRDCHHRIFGYLRIGKVISLGAKPDPNHIIPELPRKHPHLLGCWNPNNTLYVGEGKRACRADDRLRLSAGKSRMSIWKVPPWLQAAGLTYHASPARWLEEGHLQSAAKGQEFVAAAVTDEARAWVENIIAVITR